MRLGDEGLAQWFFVGGGGADKEVLGAAAGEETDIALHVDGLESDEIRDDIKGTVAEGGPDGAFVMDVANQRSCPMDAVVGEVAFAAIEYEDLMSLDEGKPHTRGTDVAAPADE